MAAAAAAAWPPLTAPRSHYFLLIFVSSATTYTDRRAAIRATCVARPACAQNARALCIRASDRLAPPRPPCRYMRALRAELPGGLSEADASAVAFRFLIGRSADASVEAALDAEAAEHGDILRVAVLDSYDNLFPRLIAGYRWAAHHLSFQFAAHADDDTFLRPERLLAELRHSGLPIRGLYYGYFWNLPGGAHLAGGGSRTRPIRDEAAKS